MKDKKIKYLIISDASSMHVYNFCKNILSGREYEIYILRHSVQEIPKQYAAYYRENNITVFSPGKANDGKGKFATVKRFLRKVLFLIRLGKVDVCHIHYLHRSSCELYRMFRRNFKKLIISFWGTDILCPPEKEFKAQKKCVPYADLITVTVEHSKDVFRQKFGTEYDHILTFGRFAGGGLQGIHDFASKKTIEECRKEFHVPDGKLCVVCGYNANPSQHQDIICNEISFISEDIRNKMHLIIPLQYGRTSDKYIDDVKAAAEKCGCSYEILEEYVPFERNSIMCLATDIYINLRDTDAFSNAMKEQIYSGSLMIQGSWLVYEELEQIGAPVIKIDALEDLHTVLAQTVKAYQAKTEIQLFAPLYDIFSVQAVRASWDDILRDIV